MISRVHVDSQGNICLFVILLERKVSPISIIETISNSCGLCMCVCGCQCRWQVEIVCVKVMKVPLFQWWAVRASMVLSLLKKKKKVP